MTGKSRLNPNPASRPTLKDLKGAGILDREKIGLRNIIRAATGAVEPCGYAIECMYDFTQREPTLNNFRQHSLRVGGLVGYSGGRAEIYATTNFSCSCGSSRDLSRHYPVNTLATDILKQPCTRGAWFDPGIPMYGDAVLITDKRMHWTFSKEKAPEDAILEFDALLTTPRMLHKRFYGTVIVFLEEPNQSDIFTIKLAWQ
jgi:hypothetical protein